MVAHNRRKEDKEKAHSGNIGAIVQIIATLAALVMVILNQYTEPDINDLFIWAMFGLAYGAKPETINKMVRR